MLNINEYCRQNDVAEMIRDIPTCQCDGNDVIVVEAVFRVGGCNDVQKNILLFTTRAYSYMMHAVEFDLQLEDMIDTQYTWDEHTDVLTGELDAIPKSYDYLIHVDLSSDGEKKGRAAFVTKVL